MLDTEVPPERVARRTPLDLFAASFVFLSLVAFSPVVEYQAWTPKAALLPLVVAAGAPLLVRLAKAPEHRAAALAAMSFVAVAAASTVLSPHPWISAFGLYGWGTGLLFCVALASAWAIGRSIDERGRRDVRSALFAGTMVNLAVAVAQRLFDLSSYRLEILYGRSAGLLGNPVNLGGLGGAAVALAVVAWARPRIGPWLAAVAASAALVQLAGGRIALLVVIGVLAWALVRRGVKVALLATVAVVLGLAVAAPISTASGTGSTERLDSAARSEGVASRLENWYSARHAVADHPLLGSGPGTYLAATEKYRTPKLGRLDGGDSVYADAHNLAVEYVVTMGVVGLVALIAFALLAGRRAGGAMLAVALALLVAHAVQPQNVGLTPLLFLVLGAAGPRSPGHEVAVRTWPLRLVLVPLALGATGVLLFADHELRQSDLDFTESQARAAERLLPRWKEPAALLSRNFLYLGIVKDDQAEQYFEQSEQWRREAVRREPYDASMWFRLGDLQLRRLEVAEAETSFRRALAANPTSASARVGLGHTFLLKKEDATALEWLEDALTFIPNPEARADVEKLITDARAR